MTDDLRRRVFEHKTVAYEDAFTARYRVNQLVYYELLPTGAAALAREAQLKGWTRVKKITLVERVNTTWADLSDRWYASDELANSTLIERAIDVSDLLLRHGLAR